VCFPTSRSHAHPSSLSDFWPPFFAYSWDEWVPTARLLKFNEANLSLQKDLHRAQAAATSASASASKASTSARGAQTGGGGRRKEGGRGTKRGRDDDDGARRPEMRLAVPDTLKVLLVDDWEAITKNNQVSFSSTPNHLASLGSAALSEPPPSALHPFFHAVSWSHYLEVPPSRKY
jgi:mortality factor 4-like protein 1